MIKCQYRKNKLETGAVAQMMVGTKVFQINMHKTSHVELSFYQEVTLVPCLSQVRDTHGPGYPHYIKKVKNKHVTNQTMLLPLLHGLLLMLVCPVKVLRCWTHIRTHPD